MENFETIMVKFKYEGVEYSCYVHGDEVTGDTDTLWGYWLHTNNYTFQVVGDMVGDTPIYFNNLRVFVYPRGKYEDYDRIGEITEVYSQFVEEKGTKTFKDLKKGDTIYYTNGWDLYKLTISEVVINVNNVYFYFDHDGEYFRLNSGRASDDECITHIIVPYGKLYGFALSFDGCEGRFWADRLKCKKFVAYHLKKVQENFDKIGQSYYKWICNSSCSGDDENGWNTELTKSEKTYKSKDECYSAMRENAMASINSFAISDSEMKHYQKVEIEFLDDDAIWVNVGEDIRITYNIVEC